MEELGGRPTPAIGFACGLERLVLLLTATNKVQLRAPDVYLVLIGAPAVERGMVIAEGLRSQFPSLEIISHLSGGGLKSS